MTTTFYTYGNIVRILHLDEADFNNSRMIDVNMDEKTILSVFDASKPFDAAFIRSYLNILTESTVGFTLTTDPEIMAQAIAIAE